jgi:hypothetical protein
MEEFIFKKAGINFLPQNSLSWLKKNKPFPFIKNTPYF